MEENKADMMYNFIQITNNARTILKKNNFKHLHIFGGTILGMIWQLFECPTECVAHSNPVKAVVKS